MSRASPFLLLICNVRTNMAVLSGAQIRSKEKSTFFAKIFVEQQNEACQWKYVHIVYVLYTLCTFCTRCVCFVYVDVVYVLCTLRTFCAHCVRFHADLDFAPVPL